MPLQDPQPFALDSSEQKGLGSVGDLTGDVLPFELSYTFRQDYVWKLSDTPIGAWTLDFNQADNNAGRGNGVKFDETHNAILISLVAKWPTSGTGSSSAIMTDAVFEITESLDDVVLCGSAIPDISVGTIDNAVDPQFGQNLKEYWIVADRDLSRTSWKITGKIKLTRVLTVPNGTASGPEEFVKFFIKSLEIGPVAAKNLANNCAESCAAPIELRAPAAVDEVSP